MAKAVASPINENQPIADHWNIMTIKHLFSKIFDRSVAIHTVSSFNKSIPVLVYVVLSSRVE